MSADLESQDKPDRSAHAVRNHILLLSAGAVGAATFNQAVELPERWPRRWSGYGARLADQAGFAIAEESLRWAIGEVVPWRAVPSSCKGATPDRPLFRRTLSAGRCGLRDLFIVRDGAGAAHPNLPLLSAVAGASALSLTWRPERASASKGQLFVASRIGIVLGGTAMASAHSALRGRR